VPQQLRVVVAPEHGKSEAMMACQLRRGDHIILGGRKQLLTRVRHFKSFLSGFELGFKPDRPIETFLLPMWGMLTQGSPTSSGSAASAADQPEPDFTQEEGTLRLMAQLSEADILDAMALDEEYEFSSTASSSSSDHFSPLAMGKNNSDFSSTAATEDVATNQECPEE